MCRQPKIVVRRQVDDRSVVDDRVSPLLVVQDAKRPEESLVAKALQLSVEVIEHAHG
jgi:hypothetical protein